VVNEKCRLIRAKSGDHFECIMQNKANLRQGQMNISVFTIKDYENKTGFGIPENKPKQSQFYIFTAENAEYAEKNNICVSGCPIEKYAPYPISPCSLRTRRLMKNKANQSQFVFLAGENAEPAELLLSRGRCECNVLLRQ